MDLRFLDHGRDYVLTRVGVEPTPDAFKAIILDEQSNRPYSTETSPIGASVIANSMRVKHLLP